MPQNTEIRSITMIGGFDRYGSGKYMRDMSDVLVRNECQLVRISTNRMRLSGLRQVFKSLLNSPHRYVVFQPSISGISFFRDVIILLILKVLRCNISLVVLSHIFYKNKMFKIDGIRSLFFKERYVISAADIKEIRRLARVLAVITPMFSIPFSGVKRMRQGESGSILFCYIGYFDKIKGFDRFIRIARKNSDKNFLAVGDPISQKMGVPKNEKNIQFLISTEESDFSNNVKQVMARGDYIPVLIYSSRYDLAPFLILELGVARMPICVQRNTDSHQILKNFLPKASFFSFNELSEVIAAMQSGELIQCVDNLEEFARRQGQEQFDKQVMHIVECWMND